MSQSSRNRAGLERVAIFIDGANLYHATRALGFDIDFAALLQYFDSATYLVRAYYYTAIVETEEYTPLRPLVDFLAYNGYRVVTKRARQQMDPGGQPRLKGNMDIELAVDMLEMAPHLDHAVLFSGDGDFRRLVEAVQRQGVKVTVVSTLEVSPPMVSDDLRRQADAFLDLVDIAPEIARRQAEPRPRVAQAAAPAARPSRATPAEPFADNELPDPEA